MNEEKTEFGFESISDQEMIHCFNKQIHVKASVSTRARFFAEWRDEVIRRKWTYDEAFLSSRGISLRHEILLEKDKIKQIGPGQEGGDLIWVRPLLNQLDLFVQCVQKGLLIGYYMYNQPKDTNFYILRRFENAKLTQFIHELIYEMEGPRSWIMIGSDKFEVRYTYSEEAGLQCASFRDEWLRDGWCNRIDRDLPSMLSSAETLMESFAQEKGIIGEYDTLPQNECWELRLEARKGAISAFLMRDGELLQMGVKDDPFAVEVFDYVLPSFGNPVYELDLEFICENGSTGYNEMEILTMDRYEGFMPDKKELTPFTASDLY